MSLVNGPPDKNPKPVSEALILTVLPGSAVGTSLRTAMSIGILSNNFAGIVTSTRIANNPFSGAYMPPEVG